MLTVHNNTRAERLWLVPLFFAAIKLGLHLYVNATGGYGYFRDELYFLICGERLDWGYVDQPPLVGVAAWISRALFGDSVFAIRLLPALAGSARVFVTGLLAIELGGRRWAAALACVCMLVSPVALSIDGFLSMNAFDHLIWALGFLAIARVMNGGAAFQAVQSEKNRQDAGAAAEGTGWKPALPERAWLWLGLIIGIGLQNKYSLLFYSAAFAIALLISPQRRHVLSPWLWAAGGLALVIWLPNVIWQWSHAWPQFEILRNADVGKNYLMSPLEFLASQLLINLPLNAPVWIAGLAFLLLHPAMRRFRILGWMYVVMFALFVIFRGKHYYLAPAYPALYAAGGVVIERFAAAGSFPLRRWSPAAACVVLMATGLLFLPMVLPILPVEKFIPYQNALKEKLGVAPPPMERHRMGPLDQLYADMHGWPEMAAVVAQVYNALPAEERAKACIFASNYGEAGAVDFLGRKYGLPYAISGHQNYFIWGPRGCTGEVVITIGESREDVSQSFDDVQEAARFSHPYAMPYEQRNPIFVCRKPKFKSLEEIWPRVKHYI